MSPKELEHHGAAAETQPFASLGMLSACCLQIILENKYLSTDIRSTLVNFCVLVRQTRLLLALWQSSTNV